MYANGPAYRAKPPSQGTAETLALIAWILQLLFSTLFVGLGLLFLVGGVFLFVPFLDASLVLTLLAGIAVVLPILMGYVGFVYSYRRIRDGDFAGAKVPTLVLGILGLTFGGLIVGILYLIAYVETADAESESRAGGFPSAAAPPGTPAGYPGSYFGTPWSATGPAPYLPPGSVAYPPPQGAAGAPMMCPRCGRPATYIPQYGRCYCSPCARYV